MVKISGHRLRPESRAGLIQVNVRIKVIIIIIVLNLIRESTPDNA
jgi:hypothetical protein